MVWLCVILLYATRCNTLSCPNRIAALPTSDSAFTIKSTFRRNIAISGFYMQSPHAGAQKLCSQGQEELQFRSNPEVMATMNKNTPVANTCVRAEEIQPFGDTHAV